MANNDGNTACSILIENVHSVLSLSIKCMQCFVFVNKASQKWKIGYCQVSKQSDVSIDFILLQHIYHIENYWIMLLCVKCDVAYSKRDFADVGFLRNRWKHSGNNKENDKNFDPFSIVRF